MHEPILKSGWERRHEHPELDAITAQKLLSPHTNEKITTITLMSDGCANSNYKIELTNGSTIALRIYMREHSALSREAGIHQLVKSVIPVAEILYADTSCNIYPHPYAILQWVDGTLLRDLVFTHDEDAISAAMFDVGNYLAILRMMKMPYGGFFQEDMSIRPFAEEDQYEAFMMRMLSNEIVAQSLGRNVLQDTQQLVSQCCHLLPEINDANLTHADYDPANILVRQNGGTWQVAAILDWEFTFSGTYLIDIGQMLRYSHKLPDYYESSFINGIHDTGPPLPVDWKKSAKLMDLLSLTQLLEHNPAAERPFVNRDVVRLITNTIKTFPRS